MTQTTNFHLNPVSYTHLDVYKRQLVDTATQILDLHTQYLTKVGDISRHYMGVLRLGISHTCGLALLPEILPRFREEFPMVEFSLFEGNSNQLEDELAHGRIDLIVCFQPVTLEGVETLPLVEGHLIMVVPKNFKMCIRDSRYSGASAGGGAVRL